MTDTLILDASNCLSLSAFDVSRVLEGGVQLSMCDAKTFDLPVNSENPVNQGGLVRMMMMETIMMVIVLERLVIVTAMALLDPLR